MFGKNGATEYPESAILQMTGRAGRPQFDSSGVVVIMTQQTNVIKYQQLVNGSTPIESHLLNRLAEHLNAEICADTIVDLSVALTWMRTTFFYVRVLQNCRHYHLRSDSTRDEIDQQIKDNCIQILRYLENVDLLTIVRIDEPTTIADEATFKLIPTPIGRLMATYLLSVDTIINYCCITGAETIEQLLKILCNSTEFQDFRLRNEDKRSLNDLNTLMTIRFPVPRKIQTVADKIYCLLQAIMGNKSIKNASLAYESMRIVRVAERCISCLQHLLRELRLAGGSFCAQTNVALLSQSIHVQLWHNTEFICGQFEFVSADDAQALTSNGVCSFDDVRHLTAGQIETLVQRRSPFGINLKNAVQSLPQFDLSLAQREGHTDEIHLTIVQRNSHFQPNPLRRDKDRLTLLVGHTATNTLIYFDDCLMDAFHDNRQMFEKTLRVDVGACAGLITAHLVKHNNVGINRSVSLTLIASAEAATVDATPNPTLHLKRRPLTKLTEYFPLVYPKFSDRTAAAVKRDSLHKRLDKFVPVQRAKIQKLAATTAAWTITEIKLPRLAALSSQPQRAPLEWVSGPDDVFDEPMADVDADCGVASQAQIGLFPKQLTVAEVATSLPFLNNQTAPNSKQILTEICDERCSHRSNATSVSANFPLLASYSWNSSSDSD